MAGAVVITPATFAKLSLGESSSTPPRGLYGRVWDAWHQRITKCVAQEFRFGVAGAEFSESLPAPSPVRVSSCARPRRHAITVELGPMHKLRA
jgi:hypothetical protein